MISLRELIQVWIAASAGRPRYSTPLPATSTSSSYPGSTLGSPPQGDIWEASWPPPLPRFIVRYLIPVGNPPFSSWGPQSQIYRSWSSSHPLHTIPARAGGQWVIFFRNRATAEWKELAASDHIWCCSVSLYYPWVEAACWRMGRAQGRYSHFSCYLSLIIFVNFKWIFVIDGWLSLFSSLLDIYHTRLTRTATGTAGDPTHPSHSLFSLLP